MATIGAGILSLDAKLQALSAEATEKGWTVLNTLDLKDGPGNSLEQYQAKILQGSAILNDGRSLLIVCRLGRSRSMAIAAGILAARYGYSLDDALNLVKKRGAGVNKAHINALKMLFS